MMMLTMILMEVPVPILMLMLCDADFVSFTTTTMMVMMMVKMVMMVIVLTVLMMVMMATMISKATCKSVIVSARRADAVRLVDVAFLSVERSMRISSLTTFYVFVRGNNSSPS